MGIIQAGLEAIESLECIKVIQIATNSQIR
jgi:hypothetical protein